MYNVSQCGVLVVFVACAPIADLAHEILGHEWRVGISLNRSKHYLVKYMLRSRTPTFLVPRLQHSWYLHVGSNVLGT